MNGKIAEVGMGIISLFILGLLIQGLVALSSDNEIKPKPAVQQKSYAQDLNDQADAANDIGNTREAYILYEEAFVHYTSTKKTQIYSLGGLIVTGTELGKDVGIYREKLRQLKPDSPLIKE